MSSELSSASLLNDIKQIVEQARGQVKQTVNAAMVQAYWQIGCLIVEHEQQGNNRAEYGKAQLKQLSEQLTREFGKGFDVTNLHNMRRFYLAFEKRETVSLELSWSHYNQLSRIEKDSARLWYQQEAIAQNWSVRALERQIGALYYEHQDVGQMDTYVRLYDEKLKGGDDNPTIGLVLCSEKSEEYSVLSDQKQLFAAKYLPYLPSEEELKQELQRERDKAQQALQAQQEKNNEE
ncbi:PDDEXK nuclease domain-containing protein [Pseudoalteromonas sp. OOF1S-7]|uniref:PDDEXK nuclease domain-containing protein n=1 Tax=Pseudoalteromonas sp. OOF1S-7 TaxID=2917757 RepID=UPI001EF62FB0|nr:PDDEXK nuclease domain-containing protein [Pseudoalteromonas sp. OOF1S-7]MCG7537018.1 PDDEXK nuclease domain-containing protein [Pseudoalteromonas sp. OOF1S-7]